MTENRIEVPFVDLRAQYRAIRPDIDEAVSRVLQSGRFVGGPEVTGFEDAFAEYLGINHCVAVNSGTDALILGLRALGLSKGSEVIVPANTFIATALGVSENGLTPVFVDCDDTYGMSLPDLKRRITPKTAAVIVVHLYGQPDRIDDIRHIIAGSGRHIHLIEDACQAHGAVYRGSRVGTFGTFAAFSFYPGKNLGAYGDGGAVVTNDPDLAHRIRLVHEYGSPKKYVHETAGVNSRMDAMQAAVLRAKLPYLDGWNERRRTVAETYTQGLSRAGIPTPPDDTDRQSVYHIYPLRIRSRDTLQAHLAGHGIETIVHYPVPIHLQKAYAYLHHKPGDFPVAERIAREELSLPMYPEIATGLQDSVIERVNGFAGKTK